MMLRPEDKEFLDRMGWKYEIVNENGTIYVIIRDMPFSARYTPRIADVFFMVLPGYPVTKLDMFWSRPDVLLSAGGVKPPNTESTEQHLGLPWQRWSRHLEDWRPGIDGFESFFAPILKEIQKNA